MAVQNEHVPADNTSAVRTGTGAFAVPFADGVRVPAERPKSDVHDRSTEVREHVWRALLRTALGESYRFDVVPVCAPDGTGGVEVGYVLYVSAPLPVPIGSRVAVASKPFEFDAGEDLITRVVAAVVESLRKARSEALRVP